MSENCTRCIRVTSTAIFFLFFLFNFFYFSGLITDRNLWLVLRSARTHCEGVVEMLACTAYRTLLTAERVNTVIDT